MAGHGVDDDPNLKGFARYFNAETNKGRANVSPEKKPTQLAFATVRRNPLIHSN